MQLYLRGHIHPFLLPKTEEWRSNHSKVMRGKVPWNKGLTKETDPRVVTKVPPWNKGKTGVQDYSFRKTRTRKCQISKS